MNIEKVIEKEQGYIVNDSIYIPKADANSDYKLLLSWIEEGGIVEQYVEPLESEISRLKANRDIALADNKVKIGNHYFNARPSDLANIQLGIDKNDTLWPDINDYMVDVTVEDLQKILSDGLSQGEQIWDEYKQSVKAIQLAD